ncbi:MAG TPA: aldo/keto reductase, partial [Pirellulaceae bacterium]|nr:aldo/keto reductase [Pirellulaceae bacterium]
MQSRKFSNLDICVSEVGMGCWQIGGTEWGDVGDKQAIDTLHAAAESGITFFDTADIYGNGRSERLVGQFLSETASRDRIFIATKLGRRSDPGWPENFTPHNIRQHTEDSLIRLGIDVLDLTQTHCLPLEQLSEYGVWDTLADLKREGKIRAFGASVETIDEALNCLEIPGLNSLQIIFNIFRQCPTDALLE